MVTRIDVEKRTASLDIARLVALFCVVSVHFFLFNGFYSEICDGWKMFLMCCLRCSFMVCIPLFLLLTGYLMCGKTFSGRYFLGIDKTLGVYALCTVLCFFAKKYYFEMPDVSVFDMLDFSACTYAWYVEMYLGLFMLIPFLNLIFRGLEGKRQRLALIGVLLVLAQLPSMLNIYDFETPGAFADPALDQRRYYIFPCFWTFLYPLTYYFIGAYLREHPVKLSKIKTALLYVVSLLAYSGFAFYKSGSGSFVSGTWQQWESLLLVPCGVLVFLFIVNIDTSRWRRGVRTLLATASEVTFGAYLLSCLFDKLFYDRIDELGLTFFERMKYFPVVLLTLLLSLLASYSVTVIWTLLRDGGDALVRRIRRKEKETVNAQ